MSLEIIHYPHPTLRYVSKPLKRVDAELKAMVAEMFDLMYEHDGIGLAANQVDLPYRLFVCNPKGDPDEKDAECVFINPVILKGSGQHEREEGCLSIPGVYAPVVRKEKITVQAYNLAGEEISGELDGLFARVVQHETDHLDGVLFIDRLSPAKSLAAKESIEDFETIHAGKLERGEFASDQDIARHWATWEEKYC